MTSVARQRGTWTPAKRRHLDVILGVLEELHDWWPVTLRQVYYQLVAQQQIPNCLAAYKKVSRVLTQARLDGIAPWEALEDRGRRTLHARGWDESQHFIREQVEEFLVGYRRDLLLRQPRALEVWVEKDALAEIAHRAAFELCVPVVVARGFSSVSYLNECRVRVEANAARGQQVTRILYFGDLDPSGWAMLPAMLVTLRDEMGLGDHVEGVRCALTPEQVLERRLPCSVDALKQQDTRSRSYREWLRKQGFDDTIAVELDALPPADLQALVRDSILGGLDRDQLARDRAAATEDRERIAQVRERVLGVVNGETS